MENALLGLNHPDCAISADDFVNIKANWEAKPLNIRKIAEELNIGLNSCVFIDDNPAERDIVRQMIPEVAVPEIGGNVENFLQVLERNGYFEPITIQEEDRKRVKYYKANIQRLELQTDFYDYGAYLESLNMEADILPFSELYIDRITQLINKTNQFNLTTKRCSALEVNQFKNEDRYITLFGRLTDKFGDNGITAVMVGEVENSELNIDIWLMSCRVFNREFEFAMFDQMALEAQKIGVTKIKGTYIPTKKNSLVENLYSQLGFSLIEEGETTSWEWQFDQSYQRKNQYKIKKLSSI